MNFSRIGRCERYDVSLLFYFQTDGFIGRMEIYWFASQCLIRPLQKKTSLLQDMKVSWILQCERYVTSPYFSFHTSVTGIAISEDWVSYNVEKWNLLFAKKWNLLFFKKCKPGTSVMYPLWYDTSYLVGRMKSFYHCVVLTDPTLF